jgi:hypothetical protein
VRPYNPVLLEDLALSLLTRLDPSPSLTALTSTSRSLGVIARLKTQHPEKRSKLVVSPTYSKK